MTTEQRLWPYDNDAEESVIGSLLIDGECLSEIRQMLEPAMFYVERNRKCYLAALKIADRGEDINQVTLARELAREEDLESVGGAAYLGHLVATVPVSVHVVSYATVVRDCASRRAIIRLASDMAERAHTIERVSDLITEKASALYEVKTSDATVDYSMRGGTDRYLEELMGSKRPAVSTGLIHMDRPLRGGLRSKDLVVLGAYPGMGKSATAIQIAHLAARAGHRVLYLSLEMDSNEMIERMVASWTGFNTKTIKPIFDAEGDQASDVMDAIGAIGDLPMVVDYSTNATIDALNTKIRQEHNLHSLRLVIIDHLQILGGGESDPRTNKNQQMDDFTQLFKRLAMQLDITVLALSQLSRPPRVPGGKGYRPGITDFRDSGTIGQNCDVGILLEEVKPKDGEPENTDEETRIRYRIVKNRAGESNKTISAIYNKQNQRIRGSQERWPNFNEQDPYPLPDIQEELL